MMRDMFNKEEGGYGSMALHTQNFPLVLGKVDYVQIMHLCFCACEHERDKVTDLSAVIIGPTVCKRFFVAAS